MNGRAAQRALVALLITLIGAAPASAQSRRQTAITVGAGNVTLTTTTETVVVSSGPATMPSENATVCVLAWAQLTTGTMTTTVTPRIRRGTLVSGTLVNEANAVTIGAAAGSTEQFFAMACEQRSGAATVEYSLTLQQASASADGTALQAGIFVLVQ